MRRIRGGVLGIAFSLIPLVFVQVVANGMISGITLRYMETGSYHVQLSPRSSLSQDETISLIANLQSLESIIHVFQENQGLALLAGGLGHNGVQVRGIDPDMHTNDLNFSRYLEVVSGSFDLSEERSIVLGENIAHTLNISVGDTVRVITARTTNDAQIIPRVSRFNVVGIVSTGYRDLDSIWVFIRYDTSKRIIPSYESREFIGIKAQNPFDIDENAQELLLHTRGNVKNDRNDLINEIRRISGNRLRVLTWYELEQGQYMSFITTRNLLLFIMILILIVAAVNVSSAMIMLVLEKQEEIAILKALGIHQLELIIIILCAGGLTGLIGIVFGLTIGALAARFVNEIIMLIEAIINFFVYLRSVVFPLEAEVERLAILSQDYYLTTIPITLRIEDLAYISVITILLCVGMSILPAVKTLRLKPLELLHRR